MESTEFNWKNALAQLFAATVNQQTFEEAAELMVSVSASDRSYHDECLTVFDEAIRASNAKDSSIISCINRSGYQVSTYEDASDLLKQFHDIYLKEFNQAVLSHGDGNEVQ